MERCQCAVEERLSARHVRIVDTVADTAEAAVDIDTPALGDQHGEVTAVVTHKVQFLSLARGSAGITGITSAASVAAAAAVVAGRSTLARIDRRQGCHAAVLNRERAEILRCGPTRSVEVDAGRIVEILLRILEQADIRARRKQDAHYAVCVREALGNNLAVGIADQTVFSSLQRHCSRVGYVFFYN